MTKEGGLFLNTVQLKHEMQLFLMQLNLSLNSASTGIEFSCNTKQNKSRNCT